MAIPKTIKAYPKCGSNHLLGNDIKEYLMNPKTGKRTILSKYRVFKCLDCQYRFVFTDEGRVIEKKATEVFIGKSLSSK